MKLCSDGHGEVCYEDRDCPACEAVNEATAPLNNEIASPPGWQLQPIIGHDRWFVRDADGRPASWPTYGRD